MPRTDEVKRLAIVGAGLAGLRAAEAVRADGWEGDIVLIGAEDHPPYDRPPLSKTFLSPGPLDVVRPFRSGVQLREELGVEVMLGRRVEAVDAERRELQLSDGQQISYDSMVVATGADAIRLPGQDALEGVTTLRTERDAARVRRGLDSGARVVVVGAGFIGSEVASAARKRDLPVTVIDSEPVPLRRSVGPDVGVMCAQLHVDAGVDLRTGIGVERFESEYGTVSGVALTDGTTVAADLVVVGVGARPVTHWLRSAGVELHDDGGVLCGADLAASVPGIWAAGDVAHAPYDVFDGDLMRVEHWTNAADQGAIAGRNAVGARVAPEQVSGIPYFWSDWHGHRIQFVGSPRADQVQVVGDPGPGAFVLYRRADRLVGALSIDRGGDIMKLRKRIVTRAAWEEAVSYAEERAARPVRPAAEAAAS